MTDKRVGDAAPSAQEGSSPGELDEVQSMIDRMRDGSLAEEVGFEAIGRIVHRRRVAAQTGERPWR